MTPIINLPLEPWPVDWCACSVEIETASPSVTGMAVQAATEVLWAMTGRQFGVGRVTIRPCRQEWADQYGGYAWSSSSFGLDYAAAVTPILFDGNYYNIGCGSHGDGCSCTGVEQVLLPAPVYEIVSIVIDGETVPTGSYRVDDWRKLVRQDGGRWPLCQDLGKPAGEVGTWTIDLRIGQDPPGFSSIAVGELACEFVKACTTGECRLGRRIAEIARQGVNLRFMASLRNLSPKMLLLAGLDNCALFIDMANPAGLVERSRVYSPDVSYPRITG